MIKKRPFVLLEILIAFALVSTALLPFFRYPFQQMQKELSLLFEMELERIAQNKLSDLYEQVTKKQIAQGIIFSNEKQKKPLEINRISVPLAPGITRLYDEKVFITWEKQKMTKERELLALVQFKVQYHPPNKRKILLQAESKVVATKKCP